MPGSIVKFYSSNIKPSVSSDILKGRSPLATSASALSTLWMVCTKRWHWLTFPVAEPVPFDLKAEFLFLSSMSFCLWEKGSNSHLVGTNARAGWMGLKACVLNLLFHSKCLHSLRAQPVPLLWFQGRRPLHHKIHYQIIWLQPSQFLSKFISSLGPLS